MSGVLPTPLGVIGDYNLLEVLEPSGPGELFRARDTRHGRTVTVRLLPSGYPEDVAARRDLIEAARALVRLSHPNLTTLFGAGQHEGRIYLAFEHVQGHSLRLEMPQQPINVRRAVELGILIADGVAQAHASGYLHRGLAPDSIAVTARGHAKIAAFPLATRIGFVGVGTDAVLADYPSPEEARGEPGDDRSDVYSVGAVLYELLTAKPPHPRGAAAPSATNLRVPISLDTLVLQAVAPNPASRPATAAAFASALRAIERADLRDTHDRSPEPSRARGRSGMTIWLILALVVLSALGGVALWGLW